MQMGVMRLSGEAAASLLEAPEGVEDFRAQDGLPSLDLDKAWAGLDWLLAKIEDIGASFLLLGGTMVDDPEGFDFGPPRLLMSEEVDAAAQLLGGIPVERLRGTYGPAAMTAADIYPTVIWNREGAAAFDWLAELYEPLRTFVGEAAAAGDALLIELG